MPLLQSADPLMQLGAIAAAFYSADRTGLFREISLGEKSAEEISRSLSLNEDATRLILDILCTQGLIIERELRFSLAPEFKEEFIWASARPGFISSLWGRTENFLRTGGGTWLDATNEARSSTYPDAVMYLARKFALDAKKLAEIVDPMLPNNARVLDLGAGSGVWSLAMLQGANQRHAVALDFGSVLTRFEENASGLGLRERVSVLDGDYFALEVEERSFDAIIFGNILHLETKEKAQHLIERWAPALRPGGRLVLVDMMDDPENQEQQRLRASYALGLSLRVPGARVHLAKELSAWIQSAGATSQNFYALRSVGLTALIGGR